MLSMSLPPARLAKEPRSELTPVPLRGLEARSHDVMCLKIELKLIKSSESDSEECSCYIV